MAGAAGGGPNAPGQGPSRTGLANAFLEGKQFATEIQVQFDSLARDTGNTGQTYVLRKGLVVAKQDSDSMWYAYDNAGSAGVNVALGILNIDINLRDRLGDEVDSLGVVVIKAHVDDTKLFGLDAAAEVDLSKLITFLKDY